MIADHFQLGKRIWTTKSIKVERLSRELGTIFQTRSGKKKFYQMEQRWNLSFFPFISDHKNYSISACSMTKVQRVGILRFFFWNRSFSYEKMLLITSYWVEYCVRAKDLWLTLFWRARPPQSREAPGHDIAAQKRTCTRCRGNRTRKIRKSKIMLLCMKGIFFFIYRGIKNV